MSRSEEGTICTHCGAKMVEYKHTLNGGLLTGLARLYEKGTVNIKALGLTHYQWANFQKLRYWDLVKEHRGTDGQHKAGTWEITDLGIRFIEKRAQVQEAVWTYRGVAVRREGDFVWFPVDQISYQRRADYASEARPAGSSPQMNLL